MTEQPTEAQRRYLEAAIAIESVRGLAWEIGAPGQPRTGKACERRGWIEWQIFPPFSYRLTPAGRVALEGSE